MPNVSKGKKVFNTSLPKTLIRELEQACEITKIPRTALVELAIKDYLEKLKVAGLIPNQNN